jgi:hypothetical protein
MKLQWILSAVLAAGAITASAAEPAATPAPTNTAIKAASGNPVLATGKGFEVRDSELNFILNSAQAQASARGVELPPHFPLIALNQLILNHALMQKATDADRAAGLDLANLEYSNFVQQAGSPEAVVSQLKAAGLTEQEFRAKLVQDATPKVVFLREFNIKETDPITVSKKIGKLGPAYLEKLRKELGVKIVDPTLKAMDRAQRAQPEECPDSGQATTSK